MVGISWLMDDVILVAVIICPIDDGDNYQKRMKWPVRFAPVPTAYLDGMGRRRSYAT